MPEPIPFPPRAKDTPPPSHTWPARRTLEAANQPPAQAKAAEAPPKHDGGDSEAAATRAFVYTIAAWACVALGLIAFVLGQL